eukprot:jgi/Botrbrau1/14942/Bobra.0018s0046.1
MTDGYLASSNGGEDAHDSADLYLETQRQDGILRRAYTAIVELQADVDMVLAVVDPDGQASPPPLDRSTLWVPDSGHHLHDLPQDYKFSPDQRRELAEGLNTRKALLARSSSVISGLQADLHGLHWEVENKRPRLHRDSPSPLRNSMDSPQSQGLLKALSRGSEWRELPSRIAHSVPPHEKGDLVQQTTPIEVAPVGARSLPVRSLNSHESMSRLRDPQLYTALQKVQEHRISRRLFDAAASGMSVPDKGNPPQGQQGILARFAGPVSPLCKIANPLFNAPESPCDASHGRATSPPGINSCANSPPARDLIPTGLSRGPAPSLRALGGKLKGMVQVMVQEHCPGPGTGRQGLQDDEQQVTSGSRFHDAIRAASAQLEAQRGRRMEAEATRTCLSSAREQATRMEKARERLMQANARTPAPSIPACRGDETPRTSPGVGSLQPPLNNPESHLCAASDGPGLTNHNYSQGPTVVRTLFAALQNTHKGDSILQQVRSLFWMDPFLLGLRGSSDPQRCEAKLLTKIGWTGLSTCTTILSRKNEDTGPEREIYGGYRTFRWGDICKNNYPRRPTLCQNGAVSVSCCSHFPTGGITKFTSPTRGS